MKHYDFGTIFWAVIIVVSASNMVVRDSHGSIARSEAARNEFKAYHPCPATGLIERRCPGYVIDHIIALCKGGPDTPANMQYQSIAEAKAKDKTECK